MVIDLEVFDMKMLEMIAITNQSIKREEEYLQKLKKQCNEGYWNACDPENPHNIIPEVQTTIKCLEEARRTYETTMSIAKGLAY